MDDVVTLGYFLLVVGIGLSFAVLSNRVSAWIRVPAPALFLVVAAIASEIFPALGGLSVENVQRIVTVALILILFDGGMHIGRRRFRENASSILSIGVLGTLLTAGALAVLLNLVFGVDWLPALMLGTALAPTDPAVVFSVLGQREIQGRTGTILEGESGANDPVGIAMMAGLLAAGAGGASAVTHGIVEFVLQLGVGAIVGVVGGWLLLTFVQRVPLRSDALHVIRTLAGACAIYGLATIAHGSGFLAVFIAGIMLADVALPFKGEIERFHSALASLGEIVAFTLLGFMISISALITEGALLAGFIIAILLAIVVRPIFVGMITLPLHIRKGEKIFILWAGLKGAVPILLGTFILTSGVTGAHRLFDIVVVVVLFSVVVQGGLVPTVANKLGIPMTVLESEPWAGGMRFRKKPQGLLSYRVDRDSEAAKSTVGELADRHIWVSMLRRDGQLVPMTIETRLAPGDDVLVTTDPQRVAEAAEMFDTQD